MSRTLLETIRFASQGAWSDTVAILGGVEALALTSALYLASPFDAVSLYGVAASSVIATLFVYVAHFLKHVFRESGIPHPHRDLIVVTGIGMLAVAYMAGRQSVPIETQNAHTEPRRLSAAALTEIANLLGDSPRAPHVIIWGTSERREAEPLKAALVSVFEESGAVVRRSDDVASNTVGVIVEAVATNRAAEGLVRILSKYGVQAKFTPVEATYLTDMDLYGIGTSAEDIRVIVGDPDS